MEKINWKALAFWVVVVLLAVVVVIGFFSGWGIGGWNMMGPGMMGNWGYSPFGWIGMTLMWLIPIGLIVLVVVGVVWLVSGLSPDGKGRIPPPPHTEASLSPREILQIRYARGEITREQYLQMLDDLS